MPLHGDGVLHVPAPGSKRIVMSLIETCEPNDQLVRPAAIRREAGHRVLGALELVGVADESLALRGLVSLRGARKGRTEGSKGEEQEGELGTACHCSHTRGPDPVPRLAASRIPCVQLYLAKSV